MEDFQESSVDGFILGMTTVADTPFPADHDIADRAIDAGEDPAVEDLVGFGAGDIGVLAVEYDEIG